MKSNNLNNRMISKTLIKTSQVLSWVFTPFIVPFLAFIMLFLFSYLRVIPYTYKVLVLSIVFLFTILIPTFGIVIFKIFSKKRLKDLNKRKERFIPLLLTIISYVYCLFLMNKHRIPWYMTGIILASLISLSISFVLNFKWRLSEHMIGIGSVIGGLVSFGALFGFNPLQGLVVSILVAGMLGTARIILKHQSLGEVLTGFSIGLISTIAVFHPITSTLFRFILY